MKLTKLNGGYQNDVYLMEEQNKIIRISNSLKEEKAIEQELKFVQFLYENGIPVPKPDLYLEKENERIKTYFEFIIGDPIDVTNEAHWNVNMFKEFGRILGQMHALVKQYKLEEIHRPIWTTELQDVFDMRENLSPEMQEKYDGLMSLLTTYLKTVDSFGLIHNDYHQGNFIVQNDGVVTIIDFDDCSYNWFAQDIAVLFYHAYWQHHSFNENIEVFPEVFMASFFKGYQEGNLLHEDIVKQIPIFLKIREIFLYQLFLQKWDMNNLEEWQEYTLDDLEYKIKNDIPYAGIQDFSIYL